MSSGTVYQVGDLVRWDGMPGVLLSVQATRENGRYQVAYYLADQGFVGKVVPGATLTRGTK